ncbi:MAG: tRNA-dihydrouridine synthase [Candidatus Omnitrophota bacterium]
MKIGHLQFGSHPLFLAPMHEVTDIPFRSVCKKMGADAVITEFVCVEAIIRDVEKAKFKSLIHDDERPAGIQIYGKNPDAFKKSIGIIASKFKPDFIDINAGCSAGKHATRGECAGLLRDLPLFEKIVTACVKETDIPVTVKTRLGWDNNNIVIPEVAKMVEQAGAKALTVHCRTRSQKYQSPADWSWLEKIKKIISIPLIGNGDVMTGPDAGRMFATGCDAVMIGRGALHNPWIFNEIKCFLNGQSFELPSLKERVALCLDHLQYYARHHNLDNRLYAFRKFYSGYFKGIPGSARLKGELMTLVSLDEIESYLRNLRSDVAVQV